MGSRLSQSEYNIHTPAHQSPLPQSWQRWNPCRVELTPVRKSGVCQTTVNDQSLPVLFLLNTKRTYNFFDLLTDSIKSASNNRLQKRAYIFQNRIEIRLHQGRGRFAVLNHIFRQNFGCRLVAVGMVSFLTAPTDCRWWSIPLVRD